MPEKPSIKTTKNTFKVILPNINAKYESTDIPIPKAEKEEEKLLSAAEQKMLNYVKEHGYITKQEAIALLKVSRSTATRLVKKLVEANLLIQEGKARSAKYKIVE